MKFSFSTYAFLASALVAAAVTTPSASAVDTFKLAEPLEAADEPQELDVFEAPDLDNFDDGKRRHLTSSEDLEAEPTPAPNVVPDVTQPPTKAADPVCDYIPLKQIKLGENRFGSCQRLSLLPYKRLLRKCAKTRYQKQCPGICDFDRCDCYDNDLIGGWTLNRSEIDDRFLPEIVLKPKFMSCVEIRSAPTFEEKERRCAQNKGAFFCRDTCRQIGSICGQGSSTPSR